MGPERSNSFSSRLRAGERHIGTFVKVPTVHTTEVLSSIGFDFIVIDQEHAPFDLSVIDVVILAARANGVAPIVRIGDASDGNILSLLDCGAAGIMVPHVDSPEKAHEVAMACRYRGGRRGFSRTGRAGGYGAVGVAEHLARQDEEILCIAMIEEPAGVDNIDAIVAVPGIDAVFVGRGDLSVAMGEISTAAPAVRAAVETVARATRAVGKTLIMLAESPADQAAMAELGAASFLIGSDLAFLRRAAQEALTAHGPK